MSAKVVRKIRNKQYVIKLIIYHNRPNLFHLWCSRLPTRGWVSKFKCLFWTLCMKKHNHQIMDQSAWEKKRWQYYNYYGILKSIQAGTYINKYGNRYQWLPPSHQFLYGNYCYGISRLYSLISISESSPSYLVYCNNYKPNTSLHQ